MPDLGFSPQHKKEDKKEGDPFLQKNAGPALVMTELKPLTWSANKEAGPGGGY